MISLGKESITNIFLDYTYFDVLWGKYYYYFLKYMWVIIWVQTHWITVNADFYASDGPFFMPGIQSGVNHNWSEFGALIH